MLKAALCHQSKGYKVIVTDTSTKEICWKKSTTKDKLTLMRKMDLWCALEGVRVQVYEDLSLANGGLGHAKTMRT